MYRIKQGAAVYMSVEIENMLAVICPVFKSFYLPVIITSGIDGPHREGSEHGRFRAIDIRKNFPEFYHAETWHIHGKHILDVLTGNFRALKYPVNVVNEEDHIHIEWKESAK